MGEHIIVYVARADGEAPGSSEDELQYWLLALMSGFDPILRNRSRHNDQPFQSSSSRLISVIALARLSRLLPVTSHLVD